MDLSADFIKLIERTLPNEAQQLISAITGTEPAVSIRVNDAKVPATPPLGQPVPWCPLGFYLSERPQFTFDIDFQAGRYYVQDASSMFIWHVIKSLVKSPVAYLDLCAAPGGKTTAALSTLPQGSLVVANEVVPSRARILCDNVAKWGIPECLVTSSQPADLGRLKHCFDVIAADVPCSGEGMMRKDDEAVSQWTPALVDQCAARQRTIIADVWQALKPGGLLIYSTCTYNRSENEDMIEWIAAEFGATSLPVPVLDEWNITPAVDSALHAYRFLPHRTRGEGLFMAVLQKPDDQPCKPLQSKKAKPASKTAQAAQVCNWLTRHDHYAFTEVGDTIVATPQPLVPLLALMQASRLNVLLSGIQVATLKGKNLIPHWALAHSTALNREAFNIAEVDYPTAIHFLQGLAVSIDAPRGYVLLTHRGTPVGWVNNLGNRANNLLPKPLRIISQHIPDEPPQLLS